MSNEQSDRGLRVVLPNLQAHVAQTSSLQAFLSPPDKNHLSLLSYNIQVGIESRGYQDYLLKSWQHLWPSRKRQQNLDRISQLIRHFDFVGLQEVDGGSFRSNFINQIEYLANQAEHAFWFGQLNRNFGRIAQHSNAILSRTEPKNIALHTLPGLKGRGAIACEMGNPKDPILVVTMHLALSHRAQNLQLHYIRELMAQYRHVILMGDMNSHSDHLLHHSPLKGCGLKTGLPTGPTFPSWQPKRCLDHILVSDHLDIVQMSVIDFALSDHLPIALQIKLPS